MDMYLEAGISQIVSEESYMASRKHGKTFQDLHQAYAVIKEELEEAMDEIAVLHNQFDVFWSAVKADETESALEFTEEMQNSAEKAICELVQVAAMCHKARVGKERHV